MRAVKHSVTINGRRTSVTLEPRFWGHLLRIAGSRGLLIGEIVGAVRETRHPQANVSAALRTLVLEDLERRAFPGLVRPRERRHA